MKPREWWVRIGVEGRTLVVLTLFAAAYTGLMFGGLYLSPFR